MIKKRVLKDNWSRALKNSRNFWKQYEILWKEYEEIPEDDYTAHFVYRPADPKLQEIYSIKNIRFLVSLGRDKNE